MSFQKTAALNVEADCTIAAEGWIHQATTGNAGHQRTQEDFPQPAVRCGTDGLRAGVVNPPGLTCAALPLTSEGRQRIKR